MRMPRSTVGELEEGGLSVTVDIRPPRSACRASATVLVAVVLAGPARAAEDARGAAPLARLALSAEVAAWGREAKEPLALVVAASIRAQIATRTIDRAPERSGPSEEAATAVVVTPDHLLGEATALSHGDATIAALVADVKAAATKGLVQGAGASRATVPGAGTDWYRRLRFEGSRYAETYVELAGPGTVSVSVFDAAGNLVCRDPNPSSVAYCGWTPSSTALFDVRVENRSTAPVPYRLFTN